MAFFSVAEKPAFHQLSPQATGEANLKAAGTLPEGTPLAEIFPFMADGMAMQTKKFKPVLLFYRPAVKIPLRPAQAIPPFVIGFDKIWLQEVRRQAKYYGNPQSVLLHPTTCNRQSEKANP